MLAASGGFSKSRCCNYLPGTGVRWGRGCRSAKGEKWVARTLILLEYETFEKTKLRRSLNSKGVKGEGGERG